jgi:hypothetical protein
MAVAREALINQLGANSELHKHSIELAPPPSDVE